MFGTNVGGEVGDVDVHRYSLGHQWERSESMSKMGGEMQRCSNQGNTSVYLYTFDGSQNCVPMGNVAALE